MLHNKIKNNHHSPDMLEALELPLDPRRMCGGNVIFQSKTLLGKFTQRCQEHPAERPFADLAMQREDV